VGERFGSGPVALAAVAARTAWIERLALPAILALGLVLRFYQIGDDSLWFDEGWSVRVSHLGLVDIVRQSVTEDTHPPLYYLLLHGWVELFGDSEAAVRSLSALLGALLIPVVYRLGIRLVGTSVGLTAALFVAVSELHVRYSQEARMYTLLALLSGLSFLTFLAISEKPTRQSAALYVGATTLLLYSHVYGIFVLLAQMAVILARVLSQQPGTRLAEARRWSALQGLALLLYAPWLVALARQTSEELRGERANLGWIGEPPSLYTLYDTALHYIGTRSGVFAVIALVIAVFAANLRRFRGSRALSAAAHSLRCVLGGRHATLLTSWLLAPILAPFLLSHLLFPFYVSRYTFAASVAAYLLIAILIHQVPGALPRLALTSLVAGFLLFATVQYHDSFEKEPWREVAALIETGGRSGEVILFDPPWTQRSIFDYYYSSRQDIEKRPASIGAKGSEPGVWTVTVVGAESRRLPSELERLGYEETFGRVYEGAYMTIGLHRYEPP
jgi:uncharacterized membrane protein